MSYEEVDQFVLSTGYTVKAADVDGKPKKLVIYDGIIDLRGKILKRTSATIYVKDASDPKLWQRIQMSGAWDDIPHGQLACLERIGDQGFVARTGSFGMHNKVTCTAYLALVSKLRQMDYDIPMPSLIPKEDEKYTADSLLKEELARIGFPKADANPWEWDWESAGAVQSLAEAVQKTDGLQADLQYAIMLMFGLIGTMRQVQNMVYASSPEDFEQLKSNLLKLVSDQNDLFLRVDKFSKHFGSLATENGWRKKVWVTTKDGKHTLRQSQPKQVWNSTTQEWEYQDKKVSPAWLVTAPHTDGL